MKNGQRDEAEAAKEAVREINERVAVLDEQLSAVDAQTRELLLTGPNLPDASVPAGADETENVEVRRWGTPREFAFEPQAHWDLGTALGILDFETAAAVTGARFVFYKGLGSRLERSLVSFMLDLHSTEHGYWEVLPPFMVNRPA